jgi:hypothetical protein
VRPVEVGSDAHATSLSPSKNGVKSKNEVKKGSETINPVRLIR